MRPASAPSRSGAAATPWSCSPGFAGAALAGAVWPLSLVALLSTADLVRRGWRAFTPAGEFGWANRVTTVRFALVLLLGAFGPATPGWLLAAALGVAAALDVADGFIARRYGLSSEFGAAFDIETDALLTLIAEAQLWQRGRAGAWILIPGLLRYAYVLALAIVPATAGHVRSSRFARRAFVALLVGLSRGAGLRWSRRDRARGDRHRGGHVFRSRVRSAGRTPPSADGRGHSGARPKTSSWCVT